MSYVAALTIFFEFLNKHWIAYLIYLDKNFWVSISQERANNISITYCSTTLNKHQKGARYDNARKRNDTFFIHTI